MSNSVRSTISWFLSLLFYGPKLCAVLKQPESELSPGVSSQKNKFNVSSANFRVKDRLHCRRLDYHPLVVFMLESYSLLPIHFQLQSGFRIFRPDRGGTAFLRSRLFDGPQHVSAVRLQLGGQEINSTLERRRTSARWRVR